MLYGNDALGKKATKNTDYKLYEEISHKKDLQEWGEINEWTKLEILKSTLNQIEFKAYYNDENGKPQIHHEHSLFKNLNGRWYYVSGKFMD